LREAANAHRATRVKVLLIAVTGDEKIGPGSAANLGQVRRLVEGLPGFDPTTDLIVVKGDDGPVTGARILQAVEALHVEPTDTLLCFISCHGAYSEALGLGDPLAGHFFQLPGGDLERRTLLGRLKDKGAQLTVLISDTCNVPAEFNYVSAELGAASLDLEPIRSRYFEDLLFNHVGIVDIGGAAPGQFGFYYNSGGWFTTGLFLGLAKCEDKETDLDFLLDPSLFATGRKVRADWRQFTEVVSAEVSALFLARKAREVFNLRNPEQVRQQLEAQPDQRPQVYELDVRRVTDPLDGAK
jgi:hypothetical protein